MRLNAEKLFEITGLKKPSAQAKWFRDKYGVTIPCDRLGPIITQQAFEKLVERSCGLNMQQRARPEVVQTRHH